MNLMDPAKEKLLYDSYELFMATSISNHLPLQALDGIVAQEVSGFGTAVDEKLLSLPAFRELMERQRQQSAALDLSWQRQPFSKHIAADGNHAVFAEDLFVDINMSNQAIHIYMRLSTVLEYRGGHWLVVHWHGSKPENVSSDTDTFGVEEWIKRANMLEKLVTERTSELKQQKESLEQALKELHDTQAQLIQSEKMASLGELTAGIAHEIQNPLNFVNNFSEVSVELAEEMDKALQRNDAEEAAILIADIRENLEKINHHGNRAGSIVRGMLQHSRTGTGKKEPTDINALADEYLRLSYHGLRARDKSFNAGFITNFDETIGKLDVMPQDMGRVLLNLFNNAFYAVWQKKKQAGTGYEPEVTVTTRKKGDTIEIIVKDNGTGIPQKLLDKVYQPFFTTKPTGEGTGLGLSLSYDIVVKGHGGRIDIHTEENRFSEFAVSLPAG